MPLYEYHCDACHHRFELIQKFSDPPAETCPACGGQLRKLLSSPAIQFKGSGWYITDYARKGGGDGKGATPASESGAASSSTADAKAEKKAGDTSGSPSSTTSDTKS